MVNRLVDAETILNTLINAPGEYVIIVNKYGVIEYLSSVCADFFETDLETAIGKQVTDIIENSGMLRVLQTGKNELAKIWRYKDKRLIVYRVPIYKDGEIFGAFAKIIFKDIGEVRNIYNHIHDLRHEIATYRTALASGYHTRYSLDSIITENETMRHYKEIIRKVAATNSGILITGETGTGKELFAHAIHHESPRSDKPFVGVNCSTIPQELLESELFGYEGGAFTGADRKGKIGLVQVADGGTLFLDEIGDLPLHFQTKLLRFLQEKELRRVGSNLLVRVDVRIIAATNRNLQDLMVSEKFRSDLYYRLCVVHCHLPPLRERKDDILLLARHLTDKICNRNNLTPVKISREVLLRLQTYDWPGNIRELENVLENAINFVGKDRVIKMQHLHPIFRKAEFSEAPPGKLRDAMGDYEKAYLEKTLRCNKYNKTKTAGILGVSRTCLYEKMTRYGIKDCCVQNSEQ
jgi:transcriptional regulator with PAS, ATPase and Fis domain